MIQLQLTLDEQLPDLPAYAVRVSKRARSVSLRVLPDIGLEVTIPQRFNQANIPEIVRENRRWIEKAMLELEDRTRPEFRTWPPEQLILAACDQTLQLRYETPATSDRNPSARLDGDLLTLTISTRQRREVAVLIATLLKKRAREVLAPQVSQLALENDLSFRRLVVRGQRTLWGSYSSSGTLSLNYKLLFLSPDLVRYVILHELAHTRHLNHSRRFWSLLEKLQPGARVLDAQLGDAAALVPPWLEHLR